jgi:hypothetical protein
MNQLVPGIDDRFGLCLRQQNFGYSNSVRIGAATPGKVTSMLGIVSREPVCNQARQNAIVFAKAGRAR